MWPVRFTGLVNSNRRAELFHRLQRGVEGMGWLRDGSIPLRFQGGVAAPLIRRSRSFAAQTGWLVNSNKIRCATRIFVRRLRDLLLTTPSAPLMNGTFLLRRSHPSLKTEGNGPRT